MNYKALSVLILGSSLGLISCKKYPQQVAKEELKEAGYQLNQDGWFRAVKANQVSVMENFRKLGWDLSTKQQEGKNALHVAASQGADAAALFLLQHGVKINDRDAAQNTPLMLAASNNHHSLVSQLLKQQADVTYQDAAGNTALSLAVRAGAAAAVAELAPRHTQELDQMLLLAAEAGKATVIDTLSSYGASIYTLTEDGRTPLMISAERGHAEAVKMLLDLGASRAAVNLEGLNASALAERAGQKAMADLIDSTAKSELVIESEQTLQQKIQQEEVVRYAQNRQVSTAKETSPAAIQSAAPKPEITSIQGAVISKYHQSRVAEAQKSISKSPDQLKVKSLGLVMRRVVQRDLPIEVISVAGKTATFQYTMSRRREAPFQVKEGSKLPSTDLEIIRTKRVVNSSKDSNNMIEVSVVELKDTRTGATRTLTSGLPSQAHDPAALVEDVNSGKRFVASAGQVFTGEDGVSYQVTEVRSNQLLIKNQSTQEVETLFLSGEKGSN